MVRAAVCLLLVSFLAACAGTSNNANVDKVRSDASATSLIDASVTGHMDRIRTLVENGAPLNVVTDRSTPLIVAAVHGHDRVAWYLLSEGADPNLADRAGRTPLIAASAQGSQRLVKLMLSAGATVNTSGANGQTPVSAAAEAGNLSVVKTLLAAGGNVNIAPGGESLLMRVVRNGDLLMTEVLIGAGADTGFRTEEGRTALTLARQNRHRDIEMLLVQAGAER
ncbi:ankyrin repeat domain-containing protein [Marinobacter fonticola]|uniref:ankyrin repeat domain-containing protein n=1 Tax=Marinobacter fonticola TaxID=2603215 RepID=UPI0011E73E7E|nr:ankyrin repeat domain-containing protein [Marinobacter fonticola]